jgi:Holliday junction resolvasome RuvABC endonuclease subunit
MKRVLSVDIGKLHYGVCAMEFDGEDVRLVDLRVIALGERSAIPITGLIDRMIGFWDEGYELLQSWSPDEVVIEQQMNNAPTNIALAFSTYTLFRSRGIAVRIVRAASKFSAWRNHKHLADAIPPVEVPKEYSARKRAAVLLTEAILECIGSLSLGTYPGCGGSKKDDAADAFLQSFC